MDRAGGTNKEPAPKDKCAPQQPRRKRNTAKQAEAPKSRKSNTNPKPQPPKGGRRTPQGGQESRPRAPKDKHQSQPPKEAGSPGRAEAPEHQSTNTDPNRQTRHIPGRAEATKRGTPTAATSIKGQKTSAAANRNRSKTEGAEPPSEQKPPQRQTPPSEQKPQSAKRQTPTTTANHNQQQTQTAADESPKARNATQAAAPNAKSN